MAAAFAPRASEAKKAAQRREEEVAAAQRRAAAIAAEAQRRAAAELGTATPVGTADAADLMGEIASLKRKLDLIMDKASGRKAIWN